MYSYTAATLAIRAKCSLSHYYLSLHNDQQTCCHLPCCHFPVNPLSGYLPGLSPPILSRILLLDGRRRLRFYRSCDSEFMGLLSEPEDRCPCSTREVKIKSVEGESRCSRKEGKAGNCLSRRSDESSSIPSPSSTLLPGRRKAARKSMVCYGNSKKASNYDSVVVVEEEVREVQKYVDDSWREWRYSSKRDDTLDSRKDESSKTDGSCRNLGVKGVAKKIDRTVNSPQKVNSRESGSERRLQKATRLSDVQSDDLKRTSVSTNMRKIKKGDSLASTERQKSDMDPQEVGNSELRCRGKQSKMADFHFQNAAYPPRDFEETSIRGREEQAYMEQNLAHVTRDKRIQLDQRAVEQDESRRNTQSSSQVSTFHGSDFQSSPLIDDKRVMGTDVSTNLVQDSSQVPRNKRFQTELQMSIENRSKGREETLTKEGNSIQLRKGGIKQIDRGPAEQDEAIRNTKFLSEVSQVYSGNMEPFSLFRGERVTGMEFRSDFVQGSIPSTKDKGIQVEVNEAYRDQIDGSRFNSDNIVNATSSRSPPESRVNSQEYSSTLLALNHISSRRDQHNQVGKQAYHQSVASIESERDTSKFDLTRSNNRMISSLQDTYHSRVESLKEISSAETSSVVLAEQKKEIERSSITGESSQSATMQMASMGSLHSISSSQPTYSEPHYHGSKADIQQIQNVTVNSSIKLDKSSGLHIGEFVVDKPQKEIVALNEPGKEPNVSAGIQIGELDRRDIQETLGTDNRKKTFLTVVTQERKETDGSLFTQSKTMLMDSTRSFNGVSSTVKGHNEVDKDSGRDDNLKTTNCALESAKQLDKSSAFHVDEFVDKIQQEIMSLNKSGKESNVSTAFQTEETGRRESQATTGMQLGELTHNRRYGDERYAKEDERLSSSAGSGMRGPSDEMWNVLGLSPQEISNAEEPGENFPASGTMELTTPSTTETAITRSPKSLWSYVTGIIRMSWILRGHPHSSTLKSDKGAPSNESLSSEAWFSGPESDEDETQNIEKIGLLKESASVKETVKLPLEGSKNRGWFTVTEPHSSISSGVMTSGLSTRIASSSVETERTEDSKSSQGTLSSVAIVKQQLASKADAESPSITDIIESRIRDKVKVLKPSSSYPVSVMRTGFSSSITQATCIEQMEAAQVREGKNSSLENFQQPLVSTADSALHKITDIDEIDIPGNPIPKLELDPFREKLPEVGGTKEAELKRRKVQRNKQVRREQFDEWEEAFLRENEQKKLDEYFMREAIWEAKKGADIWEVPVGAVLVQNGKIIARGCNRVEELRDSTAHAEMICIREASNLLRTWRLAETTLYVTLEPCPMCAGAILQARIDTVVWGAPNRLLGADGSWVRLFPGGDGESSSMNPPSQMAGPVHPFHPKLTIRRGVLETECGDVMQQFFKLRRKKDKKPDSSPASCLPISNRPTKFFTKLHNLFCMMFCL